MPVDDLTGYYAQRAAEYERIYEKPERQADLALLREWLPTLLTGRDVLEVACGTGYWTALVAPAARSMVATDASPAVLDVARRKAYPEGRVQFLEADAFALDTVPGGPFTGALAAFWWSHVRHGDLARFLDGLEHRLALRARVVLLDNRYVEGSSTPLARTDADGNTYQRRRLDDGTEHEVLKNFPSDSDLRAVLTPYATRLEIRQLGYYWVAVLDARGSHP
jgi:demethylmenaquinone methyltransferase/2-methoxy-6-polyprenyl-1,4-benzoquinol methylase